jgi:hypothetical protein
MYDTNVTAASTTSPFHRQSHDHAVQIEACYQGRSISNSSSRSATSTAECIALPRPRHWLDHRSGGGQVGVRGSPHSVTQPSHHRYEGLSNLGQSETGPQFADQSQPIHHKKRERGCFAADLKRQGTLKKSEEARSLMAEDNSRTRLFLQTVACTVQSQGAELCPEEA